MDSRERAGEEGVGSEAWPLLLSRLLSFPAFLFPPLPWLAAVQDGGAADGVWELWACLSGTELPGPVGRRQPGVFRCRAGAAPTVPPNLSVLRAGRKEGGLWFESMSGLSPALPQAV